MHVAVFIFWFVFYENTFQMTLNDCSLLPLSYATKTLSPASAPLAPESAQAWTEIEHFESTPAPLASL